MEIVDDLAAIAEQRSQVVIEDLDGTVPTYLVLDGDVAYRYTAAG